MAQPLCLGGDGSCPGGVRAQVGWVEVVVWQLDNEDAGGLGSRGYYCNDRRLCFYGHVHEDMFPICS